MGSSRIIVNLLRLILAGALISSSTGWRKQELAETQRPQATEEGRVERLIKQLKSVRPQERGAAASALRTMGPAAKDAVPALIKALGDEDWVLRQNAAEALGEIGPAAKDALPKLKELAEKDKDARVQQTAKQAIEKIQ